MRFYDSYTSCEIGAVLGVCGFGLYCVIIVTWGIIV